MHVCMIAITVCEFLNVLYHMQWEQVYVYKYGGILFLELLNLRDTDHWTVKYACHDVGRLN